MWRPAGFNVHFGDALVIAPEKGQKILRQITFIVVGKGTNDTEIERDIATFLVPIGGHQNIARMHIRVEKTIAENLREKYLHAHAAQPWQVNAKRAQLIYLRHRGAPHALHHHDARGTPIPMYFRHQQQVGVQKIVTQLRAIRRFTHQIKLVVQVLGEFRHHLARLEAATICPETLKQAGGDAQ